MPVISHQTGSRRLIFRQYNLLSKFLTMMLFFWRRLFYHHFSYQLSQKKSVLHQIFNKNLNKQQLYRSICTLRLCIQRIFLDTYNIFSCFLHQFLGKILDKELNLTLLKFLEGYPYLSYITLNWPQTRLDRLMMEVKTILIDRYNY